VTKAELIAELRGDNRYLRQEDAELIVAIIFDQIAAALARGDPVVLRGFGTFTAKWRKARSSRNPRTGAAVSVKAKTAPFFKAGVDLRRRLNRPDAQGRPGRPAQFGQRDVASASAASTAKK
jgi:integration host factor subunit beta